MLLANQKLTSPPPTFLSSPLPPTELSGPSGLPLADTPAAPLHWHSLSHSHSLLLLYAPLPPLLALPLTPQDPHHAASAQSEKSGLQWASHPVTCLWRSRVWIPARRHLHSIDRHLDVIVFTLWYVNVCSCVVYLCVAALWHENNMFYLCHEVSFVIYFFMGVHIVFFWSIDKPL